MTKNLVLSSLIAIPLSLSLVAEAPPTDTRPGAPVVNLALTETEVRAAQEAWIRPL
jgi:hypothetical protein